MSFSLSSLDVKYLVKEVAPIIADAFVDKVYQGKEEKGEVLFRLRSPKLGKLQLFLKIPEAFFLTDHKYVWPDYPSGFCMQLRKQLMNTQLVSLEQHGFERIVILTFRKGETVWKLIIELFNKGNIVLVSSDNIIRGVMDLQRWKDRTLRVNAPYEFPPDERRSLSLSAAELEDVFRASGKDLVKFCATNLGLGGKYAEELVASSSLDKKALVLTNADAIILHRSLEELFERPLSPVLFVDDTAPFSLKSKEGESVESFSSAIESLVVTEKTADVAAAGNAISNKATNKWKLIIDEQTQKVAGYEKSATENYRKGEFIYEKYQDLNALFTTLQSLHKKSGWSAVKEYITEKNFPLVANEEKGTITLTLKE
jgi:predicted ribosome quality control (RQC) complex YloA/Tae2 family protein